jgi:hypothetical protein
VRDYLDQVDLVASDGRFHYLALSAVLTVPDICSALESPDGEANGARYKAWVNQHVAPLHLRPDNRQPFLTGEDCWRFRCSFLHQGRTQHPASGYTRILFIEPGAPILGHMNVLNDALQIDVHLFCAEMVTAAKQWLADIEGTEPYETNLNAFVRRYPTGLAPYIVGVPVIS